MIYKPFHDLNLSYLGMGNMRLPTVEERGPIDEEKARKVIEFPWLSQPESIQAGQLALTAVSADAPGHVES
jgi:hypothetical protein